MGVYVKGMKIPKCCAGCDAEEYYENSYGDECGFFCPFGDKAYTSETRELKRLDDCPLVPVPPHGRLIDADVVIDLVMQYCPDDDGVCSKAGADLRELLDEIENLPTVIPATEAREAE